MIVIRKLINGISYTTEHKFKVYTEDVETLMLELAQENGVDKVNALDKGRIIATTEKFMNYVRRY